MERVGSEDRETVEAVEDVELTQLAAGERMSVQAFSFEPGSVVPAHSHHHEQCGYVFEGTLTFLVGEDETEIEIGPGDSYTIPGGERHGVENRGETTVHGVDIFSPPRTDPDWAE